MDAEFVLNPDPLNVAENLRDLGDQVAKDAYDYGEEIALRVVADARRGAPVDTGRLRADIDYEVEVSGSTVTIRVGNNVEYAEFQEVLSPYLRPAWSNNEAVIGSIIEEYMIQAMEDHLG